MDTLIFIGQQVTDILVLLLTVYSYVIFARIIMSWFVQPDNSILQFLIFLTEPLLAPIRKRLEPLTRRSRIPFDFSPIIAFFILSIISRLIDSLF